MPPTTAPGAQLAAPPSAPLPGTWSGPIAYVNQPSSDGRYLRLGVPGDLTTREFPMPLLYQADLAPGHDGGTQGLGVITRAWIDGDKLMAAGCYDMADPVAADLARKTAAGYVGNVSVDLEPNFDVTLDMYDTMTGRLLSSLSEAEIEELGLDVRVTPLGLDINPVNYEDSDEVAQDDQKSQREDTIPVPQAAQRYAVPVTVFDNWRLMSATLVSQPAFADARIHMDPPAPAFAAGGAAPVSGQACAECGGAKSLEKGRAKSKKLGKAARAAAEAGAGHEHERAGAGGCACASGSCGCSAMACACEAGSCPCEAAAAARAAAAVGAGSEFALAAAAARRAEVSQAMAALRAEGAFGTPPVADGNPAWDADAAKARIAKWSSSDGSGDKDKISWQKYAQGFLWRDTADGAADNIGDYKFPYCDVVGGALQVIPKAVFAAAGMIDKADVPAADKETIKSRIKALYGAIGKKQGRKIPPPFGIRVTDAGQQRGPVSVEQITQGNDAARDLLARPVPSRPDGTQLAAAPEGAHESEEGTSMTVTTTAPAPGPQQAVTAGAAPIDPPGGWFADPSLPGPTPIVVTRHGRVMGHLALFGSCHTGMPDACVTPPRSKTGYSLFHVGAVLTREGDELAVGKIVLGTDHASTAASVSPQAAMAHYADTGRAVALVRAGEDEFGIWVAGSLVPEASDEQVAMLRASPLSGDWRRYGGNLELIAALAVNSPGFPVPRASARTENARVAALTAAGVLAPAAPQAPCGGGVSIDVEALAEAVVTRAESLAAERRGRGERAAALRASVGAAAEAARRSRASAARRVAARGAGVRAGA